MFVTGKLDIGTRLAEFCSCALLALDVLTHPRALSLERAGPTGPGLDYGAPEKAVFGAGKYKFSPSGDQRQAMEDEDMYDDWLASTKDNEPTETLVKDGPEGKDTAVEMSRDENQSALIKEYPQIGSPSIPEALQDVPTSGKSDVKMVDAAAEETAKLNTMANPSSSSAVSTPVYTMPSDLQKPAAAPVFEKRTDHAGHLQNKAPAVDASPSNPGTSGEAPIAPVGASNSHQVPEGSSTRLTHPSKTDLSDAESEDSMPDIVDADPDSD